MYRFPMIAVLFWLNLAVVFAADPSSLLMPKDAFKIEATLGGAICPSWMEDSGWLLSLSKQISLENAYHASGSRSSGVSSWAN